MTQGPGPFEGAREIDFRGARFALGRTDDAYAIWDVRGGPPVRTFPLTDAAWPDAWLTFQAWEAGTASPRTGEPPPGAERQVPGPQPTAQQAPAPQPAAPVMDYPGYRYGLGRAEGQYVIWDLEARTAARSFPVTDEGWRDAWVAFQELERPYVFVPTSSWEKGRPIPIRAMRAGQIVGGTFKLYFMHFWLLVGITAVILLPVLALSIGLSVAFLETVTVPTGFGTTVQTVEAPFWITLVSWGLGALGGSVLVPALVSALVSAVTGRKPSFGTALREGFRLLGPVLYVTFLLFLVILVLLIPAILLGVATALTGSLALGALYLVVLLATFVPIYIVVVRFLFALSLVVIEGRRGTDALRRSWDLVRGLWWKVFGNFLLVSLVGAGIAMGIVLIGAAVLGVVFASQAASGFDAEVATGFFIGFFVLYSFVLVALIPFQTVGILLQYFDARVRKEGFNEDVLAREVAAPAPSPAAPQAPPGPAPTP